MVAINVLVIHQEPAKMGHVIKSFGYSKLTFESQNLKLQRKLILCHAHKDKQCNKIPSLFFASGCVLLPRREVGSTHSLLGKNDTKHREVLWLL